MLFDKTRTALGAADNITEAEKKKKNDKGRPQSPDEKDKFDGLSDAAKIAYQARGTKKQRPAAAALDFSREEESAGGVNGGSEPPSAAFATGRSVRRMMTTCAARPVVDAFA